MILDYTGPSMNPTLKAGDGLRVVPYGVDKIRIGDVVVFHHRERKHHVVHRVVYSDSQGVRTRGDNSSSIDTWVLSHDDIIGRVVAVQRKNKEITIHGGARGRMLAESLRMRKQVDLTISRMLHPVYHWLAKSGIFRKLLSHLIRTRVLCFRRSNGVEMQLLMGRRVIGRSVPGRYQWHIRRPFRLLVNEASLPQKTASRQQ